MNRLDMEDVAEICKASGPAGGPARPRSRSPRRGNGARRLSIAARWGTMPPLFYVGRLRRVRRRADCGDGGRMKGPDEHTPRACKRHPRPFQGRRAGRQFGSPGACGSQWRTSLRGGGRFPEAQSGQSARVRSRPAPRWASPPSGGAGRRYAILVAICRRRGTCDRHRPVRRLRQGRRRDGTVRIHRRAHRARGR